MPAKFELYNDKAGKYRFRLKAANGEVIAVGEAYESKASAKNGVESVKKNAAGDWASMRSSRSDSSTKNSRGREQEPTTHNRGIPSTRRSARFGVAASLVLTL